MLRIGRRPRRYRRTKAIRDLVEETSLSPKHLVLPVFIVEGHGERQPIQAMPGVERLSLDLVYKQCEAAINEGLNAIALFPYIDTVLRDDQAKEALNPKGLLPKAIKEIKMRFPELCLMTDVALDPFTRHGHDGLVKDGIVLNDETIAILTEMALLQAMSGADFVCPSDMMDGRVGAIRSSLDKGGFQNTGIISYTAKYASAFYGPFREALDSTPLFGDKRSYQMNPANSREALLEAKLDAQEGADILMVKPALPYLDVIAKLKQTCLLPIAAYNVSGEYAMVKAAAKNGWLNEEAAAMEILTSIHRAGADLIWTYYAVEAARWLRQT